MSIFLTALNVIEKFTQSSRVVVDNQKIDLTLNENHNFGAQITTGVIDGQTEIGKLYKLKAPIINLRGYFKDDGVQDGILNGGTIDSWQEKRDALLELMSTKQRFDMNTNFKFYQGCIIDDLTFIKDSSNRIFSCDFTMQVYQVPTTVITQDSVPYEFKGTTTSQKNQIASKKNIGKKQAVTKNQSNQRNQSLLYKLVEF